MSALVAWARASLLEREGEPHDRLRALVAGVFQRGQTARLEPGALYRLVAELAAQVHDGGEADVMEGIAHGSARHGHG